MIKQYIEISGLTQEEFFDQAFNNWLPLCKVNKGVAKLFMHTSCDKLVILSSVGMWNKATWNATYYENTIFRYKPLKGKAYLKSLSVGTGLMFEGVMIRVCQESFWAVNTHGGFEIKFGGTFDRIWAGNSEIIA